MPDAEVHWPDEPASPYPGQVWAVEAELTPKGSIRTTAIMTTLLARATGLTRPTTTSSTCAHPWPWLCPPRRRRAQCGRPG